MAILIRYKITFWRRKNDGIWGSEHQWNLSSELTGTIGGKDTNSIENRICIMKCPYSVYLKRNIV